MNNKVQLRLKRTNIVTKRFLQIVIFSTCLLCILLWYLLYHGRQMIYVSPKKITINAGSASRDSHLPNTKCIGAKAHQPEDLFCMERPAFLQNYKNPCWYSAEAGQRKLRCLPYYHILGVSKSGTSDLSVRIRAHEDVLGCGRRLSKDIYYWSNGRYGLRQNLQPMKKWNFSKYVQGFPAYLIEESVSSDNFYNKITGDGTPTDFYRFHRWENIPQNAGLTEPVVVTPHLMKHVYKDPKFIIIFRNPTDRLYSDYIFLNHGDSPQSFHKHVLQAIQIEEDCMRNNTERQCLYSLDVSKQLPTRIYIGYYSVYMKEWLNVFRRENFLILRTEDYNHDMNGTLRKVYDYLKLNYNEEFLASVVSIPHIHVTERKKTAGPMLKETRLLLDKLYRPYLEELAVLLQDERFLWLT